MTIFMINKNFASDQIAGNDAATHSPIWTITEQELMQFPITPLSVFGDQVWKRPVKTPGVKKNTCNINWGLELFDGSRLTDRKHARMLDWAKKLMAILLVAPSDGFGPAAGSMGIIQQGFKWLLSWMTEHAYQCPVHLTPDVIAHYLEDLPRFAGEYQENDEITETHVLHALKILPYLWSERRALEKWGVVALRANPFYERSAFYYAKQISTKAGGWIQPLPDEVAIPLFNTATWFLGRPAEDILRLLKAAREPHVEEFVETAMVQFERSGTRESKVARIRRANNYLAVFRFSVLPGEAEPWHVPLDRKYESSTGCNVHIRVRQLFEAVREACAITIQGTTGMRISELMGIEAGMDASTALPRGVRVEKSATGLYEIFLIRTFLSKTEIGMPRHVDWVLGLRPIGSADEPLPVRALLLLNQLHDPWRNEAKTSRLFLASTPGVTLPLTTTAMGAMESDKMRDAMKRFVERWVALSHLPDESAQKFEDNDLRKWRESKGRIITSHMLRKSWAQFIYAVHPHLMPAIQLQFHHLSIAMTDSGYIGHNPLAVGVMDSVATQQRNALIFEQVLGRRPLAGKMGEQIESVTRELAAEVKALSTSEAYQRVVRYCDDNSLKIFFNPHGKCVPIKTSKMRCHQEVNTPIGLRVQPNSATRHPSLCAGCDCFVMDGRDAPFWKERYLQNWIAYKRAERAGIPEKFRVLYERAKQAGKLLKKIGVTTETLDEQVEKALEDGNVTI
jgi:integrase